MCFSYHPESVANQIFGAYISATPMQSKVARSNMPDFFTIVRAVAPMLERYGPSSALQKAALHFSRYARHARTLTPAKTPKAPWR